MNSPLLIEVSITKAIMETSTDVPQKLKSKGAM
jgi:hypothetical protein